MTPSRPKAPAIVRRSSVVRALLFAMLGTGIAMGLVFPLVVAPFADYREGMRPVFSGLCLAAGFVVGAANFLLVRRFLLRTVERVTGQLATLARGEGTVATRLTLDSDDALGRLVDRFNALLERLQESLQRVSDTVEAFVAHAGTTGDTARELAGNAERKGQVVAGTAVLFDGLRRELDAQREVVAGLQQAAEESAGAVVRQIAQVEAVNAQVGQLQQRNLVNADGIALSGGALQRSGASTELLTRALDEAAASMTEMDAAVREIEQRLGRAAAIAEEAAADAAQGEEAVRHTQEAMERIRAGVDGAALGIRSFTRQVVDIAAVTDVIDEVTEQTGLLALNAAIIAAQAGSHGAGFAVVAGQIKKLAERTAASTREIGTLVQSFREQAGGALAAMTAGQGRVEEGVVLSLRASEALGRLRAGAAKSHEQIAAIGGGVREVGSTAHYLSRTVEEIAGRARDISGAAREQEAGLAALGGTVRETREIADAIAEAVRRQLDASRDIRSQSELVRRFSERNQVAIAAIGEKTDLLATTLETMQDIDAREREAFGRCERETGNLARQAQSVRQEIERLKPSTGGAPGPGPEATHDDTAATTGKGTA